MSGVTVECFGVCLRAVFSSRVKGTKSKKKMAMYLEATGGRRHPVQELRYALRLVLNRCCKVLL